MADEQPTGGDAPSPWTRRQLRQFRQEEQRRLRQAQKEEQRRVHEAQVKAKNAIKANDKQNPSKSQDKNDKKGKEKKRK